MASGFVGRYKGKIDVDQAWIGGAIQGRWGQVQSITNSSLTGSSLNTKILNPIGVIKLDASTVLGMWTLNAPQPGDVCMIDVSTCGSSGYFIKVSTTPTAAGITIQGTIGTGASGGSTIASVVKSTVASVITFVGLSTTQWLFDGVTPSTLGHLAWSTTT